MSRGTNRRRKVLSSIFVGCCALSVLVALLPLAFILFFVVTQGIAAINLDFFTQMPKPVGEPHAGMANAIVGTLILMVIATAIGLPIGIGAGLYLADFRGSRLATGVRFLASETTRIYCLPSCHNARRISDAHRVAFRGTADPHANGYRACRECRPDAVLRAA